MGLWSRRECRAHGGSSEPSTDVDGIFGRKLINKPIALDGWRLQTFAVRGPARALLTYIHAHVKEHCAAEKLDPHGYTFNRKTVREGIGWSDWQVRTHIRELEQLEYLKARSGAWGKEYQYELVDNDTDAGALGLILTDHDTLREPA